MSLVLFLGLFVGAILLIVLGLKLNANARIAEKQRRRAAGKRLEAQVAKTGTNEVRQRIATVPRRIAPVAIKPVAPPKASEPSSFDNGYLLWLAEQLQKESKSNGGPMLPSPSKVATEQVILDDEAEIAQKQYDERLRAEEHTGLPVIHAFMPGSKEACAAGCSCDKKLNQQGRGYMNYSAADDIPTVINPRTKKVPYVYTIGCPLHWPRDLHEKAQALTDVPAAKHVEPTPALIPKKRTPRDIFAPSITRR